MLKGVREEWMILDSFDELPMPDEPLEPHPDFVDITLKFQGENQGSEGQEEGETR